MSVLHRVRPLPRLAPLALLLGLGLSGRAPAAPAAAPPTPTPSAATQTQAATPPAPEPGAGTVPIDGALVTTLLAAEPERYAPVYADPARYRAQVLVGEIVTAKGQKPRLVRHGWRVDAEYFYPASAMKTIGAVAALQRMRTLKRDFKWLGVDTPLAFHPVFRGERLEERDESNQPTEHVTLRHLVRQMAIVSSNHAFNRLYDFGGLTLLNQAAAQAGMGQTRTLHRLSWQLPTAEQRKHPAIELRGPERTITLPAWTAAAEPLNPADLPGIQIGDAELLGKSLVPGPKSFTEKNRMSLVDHQNMLVFLVRPDLDLGLPGFKHLHRADRKLLLEAMRQRPGESENPVLPERKYNPNRFKPVRPGLIRFAGSAAQADARFDIYNKAGKAYGFRIENAYVFDKKTRRAFFFTAALYVNENGILNDGEYQYDEVADPFIARLAERVARALLVAPKRVKPAKTPKKGPRRARSERR